MEKKKTIFELELHETLNISDVNGVAVLRVPGGFIYRNRHKSRIKDVERIDISHTFVPYLPQEFNFLAEDKEVTEVNFESPSERLQKEAGAFNFLVGYFQEILRVMNNSQSNKSYMKTYVIREKIKKAFQLAYKEFDLGVSLDDNKLFGIKFDVQQSAEWDALKRYFETKFDKVLEDETLFSVIEEVRKFENNNQEGIYFDGFYVFLDKEIGINPDFDEMHTIVKLVTLIKI